MIKRPLLLAAVIYAAAMVIICIFFPKLIIPEIRFEEKEKINVSGKIYKFEEKTSQVYVYLNDVKAESAENEYSQYFNFNYFGNTRSYFNAYIKSDYLISFKQSFTSSLSLVIVPIITLYNNSGFLWKFFLIIFFA